MIRNSTAPYLMAALPLFGADGIFYGTVKDDPQTFETLMQRILADRPDVVITTGAVSKGQLDFVPDSLRALGAQRRFHGVAIRPGKPLWFGEFENGPAIFSLPGNPVSTAVALRFFIDPYLRALQGLAAERPTPTRLHERVEKAEGLRCFWKAAIHASTTSVDGPHPKHAGVHSLGGQESYRVSSLLPANAWIILPESGDAVPAETWVQTVPLYPAYETTELKGGDCC